MDQTQMAALAFKTSVLSIERKGMDQLTDLSRPLRDEIKAGNITIKTYKFNGTLS